MTESIERTEAAIKAGELVALNYRVYTRPTHPGLIEAGVMYTLNMSFGTMEEAVEFCYEVENDGLFTAIVKKD